MTDLKIKYYVAFRIETDITDDNPDYQHKILMSETFFEETDTAEELDDRMKIIPKDIWEQMFENCKEYLITNIKSKNGEYLVVYTGTTYEQILKRIYEQIKEESEKETRRHYITIKKQ